MSFLTRLLGKIGLVVGEGASSRQSRPWTNGLGEYYCAKCGNKCDRDCAYFCEKTGDEYFEQKKYNASGHWYGMAVAIDAKLKHSWCNLGISHSYLRNHEKAYKSLKEAYELGLKDATVLEWLLVACKSTRRWPEGEKYCDELAQLDLPKSERLRKDLIYSKAEYNKGREWKYVTENPLMFSSREEAIVIVSIREAISNVWRSDDMMKNYIFPTINHIISEGRKTRHYAINADRVPIVPRVFNDGRVMMVDLTVLFLKNSIHHPDEMLAGAFYAGYYDTGDWFNCNFSRYEARYIRSIVGSPIRSRIQCYIKDLQDINSNCHESTYELYQLCIESVKKASKLIAPLHRQQYPRLFDKSFGVLLKLEPKMLTLVIAMCAMCLFGMQVCMQEKGIKG